ncbi:MAG: hypothetical protein HYZ60_03000 [Methylocystis sp.]|nr:hypothetical protein [Methylocystis sp.]
MALGTLAALPGLSVEASDTATDIRLLKARLQQLESQVAKQRQEAKKAKAHAEQGANVAIAAVAKGAPGGPPPPPVFVSFKNGLFVETEDKDFSFRIGGRLNIDGGAQSEPELGSASNVGIRRARLGIEGKAFKYWNYKFEYDFANTGVAGVRDAFLAYRYAFLENYGVKEPIAFQVGNFKEPMGLEQYNSANYITFIERALVSDALHPSRHIGFAVGAGAKDWSVKGGVFSTSPQDTLTAPLAGGAQYWDLTGRATYAPIHTEDALVHLGGSFRYHLPNSSTGATDAFDLLVGRGTRNEANILGTNLLGTPDLSCSPTVLSTAGTIFALGAPQFAERSCLKNSTAFAAELAAAYGPFSAQAEYTYSHYSRDATTAAFNLLNPPTAGAIGTALFAGAPGGASADFSGYYVYGSVFLTGESRAAAYKGYDKNWNMPGTFGEPPIKNPVSKGGVGAWEFAARYSELNLNNGGLTGLNYLAAIVGPAPTVAQRSLIALSNSGTIGGRQQNLTLGLNWYPEKGFRLQANWIRTLGVVAPFDRPYINGDHSNVFLMRAQVVW